MTVPWRSCALKFRSRGLVPRTRLGSPLASASAPALWLLSAPAGYGKTTLALEWAQQMTGHAGWYSLDVSDNDPVRFFSHLYDEPG